ncbi:MAG: hypothetical protein WCR20_06155 [Verrucomicrobiota bacterium]
MDASAAHLAFRASRSGFCPIARGCAASGVLGSTRSCSRGVVVVILNHRLARLRIGGCGPAYLGREEWNLKRSDPGIHQTVSQVPFRPFELQDPALHAGGGCSCHPSGMGNENLPGDG